MAGDVENNARQQNGSGSEGVRRRHSGQHDESLVVANSEHDGVQTGTNVVQAEPQRVRFSVDTARPKKRKSDEMSRDGMDGPSERRGSEPAVSINARAANIMSSSSVPAQPMAGLPRSTGSSSSPSGRVLSASPPARSRSRGLSMRSSLFARNLDRKAFNDDSIMEMQPVGPVDGTTDRPQTSKKGNQPSVTVSPIAEAAPARPPSFTSSLPSFHKVSHPASALPNYQAWMQHKARRHLPLKRMSQWYSKTRKAILRAQEIPPSKDGRHIVLDPTVSEPLMDERTSKPHISNTIRSSKYTPWNFVPRQLIAQFSKIANFYFLTIAILQMIPGLSTTGTYTTIVPLLFFVAISMGKEGYEDFRRHRLDKLENNSEAKVLRAHDAVQGGHKEEAGRGLHWASIKWHNLRVGDVIKLVRDDPSPADIVLLRSTGSNSLAYIETMALDGETNLKPKSPSAALVTAYTSIESVSAGGAHFVVEDPNLDLYNFDGKVTINGETAPLTNNEIIYRGSVLRNTPEIWGMVTHSGEECKIRMNSNKNPRIKAPSLQAKVNKVVMVIVCFVIFLALYNTIAYEVWAADTETEAWYLKRARVPFGHVLVSFVIMFNTMIPLSLYVSMEIIKVAQMALLNSDIDMYDEVSNTPLEAKTSTINEELGQVSYVFSDKTGTLTENVMRFRKLSVAGTAWLHDADLKGDAASDEMLLHKKRKPKAKGKGKEPLRRMSTKSISVADGEDLCLGSEVDLPRKSTQWASPGTDATVQQQMSTAEMIHYVQRRPNTSFAEKAKLMILSMALCHTCLPERIEGDDDDVSYQASSPDESALVQAAKDLGYVAWERDVSALTLKTYPNGQSAAPAYEVFEVLDVIEFSSKRKRMSVVVRFPDGRICLMCKGADSVLMQRLRLANLANQKKAEVEARNDERRSMEVQEVLRRKSSVGSFPRSSAQLSRTSISRPSIGRLEPIRDNIDGWLSHREQDGASPRIDDRHYSPRPSAQLGRPSASERAGSVQTDMDDEDLVEESLASNEAAVIERCFQHINDFACEGLRTLLYGHRFLNQDDYRGWKKVYQEATTSLVDRQKRIEQAGEMIEQELELGGATAIEDKLQKGVPETIDRLRRAGIHTWMLTGDKRETAINIGHSCRLIKDYSVVTILDCEDRDVEQRIASSILAIQGGGVAHSVVVIDGQTLSTIELDKALHILFLDLAILADSVICCRASPSQKAGLVHAIRKRVSHSVTLAIGDGANDIAMIQEAHVGIGITGKEGVQAARVSDYSIAQFRFLTKLLLVHGRWNYVRTCKYIVCTFYKEMLFYLTQALFQHQVGYTGTSLYESWSLSMFNTLFTSLVVIFLGIFEQDLRAPTLIAVPELYNKGQRSAGFNLRVYAGWMFMAVAEATIIYFTMQGLYAQAKFTLDDSLYPLGDMTFTACVVVIATKLQVIEQRYRTYMAIIGWVLAVGGWALWNIILAVTYHNAKNPEYFVKGGLFHGFGRSALWWLTLLVAVMAPLAFEVAIRALKNAFFPTDVEIFQVLEGDLSIRKRFEEASAPWLQAGWRRGTKKSSVELQRDAELQAKREGEVQDLLNRPRVMEEGKNSMRVDTEEMAIMVDDGAARPSTDIREMLSRGYGKVRKESLARS
ncbi:drs2 neo1 protein [Recurvomyces mirabilis]|nr:drs2 neo1 protein [Recurvomyces mirabilis]